MLKCIFLHLRLLYHYNPFKKNYFKITVAKQLLRCSLFLLLCIFPWLESFTGKLKPNVSNFYLSTMYVPKLKNLWVLTLKISIKSVYAYVVHKAQNVTTGFLDVAKNIYLFNG